WRLGTEDDFPGAVPIGAAWRAEVPSRRRRVDPADHTGVVSTGARGDRGLRRAGGPRGVRPARPAADVSGRRRARPAAVQGVGGPARRGPPTAVLPGNAAVAIRADRGPSRRGAPDRRRARGGGETVRARLGFGT